MNSEWKEYKLGDVVDFQTGKLNSNAAEEKGIYPFFTCAPEPLLINKYKFDCNAILLAGNNANGIFHINRYKGKFNAYQRTYVFTCNPEDYSIEFVFYSLQLSLNHFKEISQGSATKFLTMNILSNLPINLPPLPEQKRIAEILSSLDDKIELNNKMNKNLEEMAQAIFKQWFVDFEFPDENGKPYKSSGGKIIQSELGEIPEGWSVKELGEVCDVNTGKTPSTKITENYGDKYPFITIPDMHNQVFTLKTERYLSEQGNQAQIKKLIPAKSIQVSCIATVGLVSINIEPSHTNQQINSVIIKNDYELFYFYESIKTKIDILKAIGSSGSTTLNVNKSQFEKIKYIYPVKDYILKFHNTVKNCFNKIYTNQLENDSLINSRDQLLPKLMSGEIRV